MESTRNKQTTPTLWHWEEPEEGMSLEDCEKIVAENYRFDKETRFTIQFMFV